MLIGSPPASVWLASNFFSGKQLTLHGSLGNNGSIDRRKTHMAYGRATEFRLVSETTLETRNGERWGFRLQRHSYHGWLFIKLEKRRNHFPQPDPADFYSGIKPRPPRPSLFQTGIAATDFHLEVDPPTRLVRYGWEWWHLFQADRDRLALFSQRDHRERWIVLERDDTGRITEPSALAPIPFRRHRNIVWFVCREDKWTTLYRGSRFWILRNENPEICESNPAKWMGLVADRGGNWQALQPAPRISVTRGAGHLTERVGWTKSEPWTAELHHPDHPRPRTIQGYDVTYEEGPTVRFIYPRRAQGLPRLDTFIRQYGRIPVALLGQAVRNVEIHDREKKGILADYKIQRIRHFKPYQDGEPLLHTIGHEVGHGMIPSFDPFKILWVSAMLADGRAAPYISEDFCEDPAEIFAFWLCGQHRSRYPHRFAVLDEIIHLDGQPTTKADLRRTLSRFDVQAGRLVMAGVSAVRATS